MNHGPRKAVLITAVIALLAGGLFFAFPGAAEAEDRAQIDEMFDQAQDLWKRGRTQECAEALKKLLAADPTQTTAYELLRKAENQMFLDLLKAGGDSALAARRLLELAHPGELKRVKDDAAIKGLVDDAVKGADHGVRTKAIRTLVANHGEYAVPALFPYLGSNDTNERVYAILALTELSSDAVLPLTEVLHSSNPLIQMNAAICLEKIGDLRAIGGLASMAAHSEDEGAKMAAAGAMGAIMASKKEGCECGGECAGCMGEMTPAGAYLMLSKKYYLKDGAVIRNYLRGYTLWSWKDDGLVSREVPSFLYHLELSEEALYDALGEEPDNATARNALSAVHFAQVGAFSALGDSVSGDETIVALKAKYQNVMNITSAQGVETALNALHIGLKYNDAAISVGALHVLPMIWDGREVQPMPPALTEDQIDDGMVQEPMVKSPMIAALESEDKTVRYAAAVALLMIDPGMPYPGAEMVVELAAQAAATGSARQVLVIEPDAETRAKAIRDLGEGKLMVITEATGIRGFRRALEVGTFDAIVVRAKLPDMLVSTLITELRQDFRTQQTPIVLIGSEGELTEAKAMFDTKVQGYAAADPINVGTVRDAASGSMNDDQKRALHLSQFACMALGMIDPAHTAYANYAAAEGALIGVVESDKPDAIRLLALGALARIGSASSADALVKTFTGTANATPVRVAAATTLGQIFKGQAAPGAVFDGLLGGFGDENAAVRMAAGTALGAMDLSFEQRNMVLTQYRVE
jgi:HEAT repeat protein